MVTPRTLPEEIESLLNTRLGDEYTAYYFYRNAANWCKNANYKKAAAFFESELAGEFIQKYVDIQNGEVEEYSDLLNALCLIDINNKLDILFFEERYF